MMSFRIAIVSFALGSTIASAACSGGAAIPSAPGVGPESGLTPLSAMRALAIARPGWTPRAVNPNRGKSWAKPLAHKSILLYAGNSDGVGFYDYKTGEQVGEITSVSSPEGICVDKKGDVYVVGSGAYVYEFAHGGTKAINQYAVSGDVVGCSVDAANDLAVTNFSSGDVCIWKGGKGSPTCYAAPNGCAYMWTAGYDDKGDLFVEGEYESVAVCALLKGSSQFEPVTVKGATIYYPNGVSWDGKYVALSDQETGGVYQTGIYQSSLSESSSGLTLTVANTVVFDDTCYSDYTDLAEPFVVGKKNTPVNHSEGTVVVGSNLWCYDEGEPSVEYWHYPAGGNSFKSISGISSAGVAVSIGT